MLSELIFQKVATEIDVFVTSVLGHLFVYFYLFIFFFLAFLIEFHISNLIDHNGH